MQTSQNIFKRILAALIFFTRLPFWKITEIDKEYYKQVVPLWPLVGWLTGGIMAIVFCIANILHLSIEICIILALTSRVLVTGALHEDGFADFCDGFGGGTNSQRTLEIMKDSHIGTYGVLGLIIYYLLLFNTMSSVLGRTGNPLLFIAADSVCKYLGSTIIYFLPYARKEEEAKNKLIYTKTPLIEKIISFVIGFLPLSFMILNNPAILISVLTSVICCTILFWTMHKKIQGYTGDCCGATFIITEMVFYVTLMVTLNFHGFFNQFYGTF